MLDSGWFTQLDDCFALEAEFEVVKESGSEHEAELRKEIKALGGTAGGRSSIKTLEKQLEGASRWTAITKGQLVNVALKHLAISGSLINPSPEDEY